MIHELKPFSTVRRDWEPQAQAWYKDEIVHPTDRILVSKALLPFAMAISTTEQVIDIAGGANNSVYYPKGYDMQRVTVIDASEDAILLNPSGHKIHADARMPLDLPDSQFNLGICVFGMRYFENQEDVIFEMLRVLKKEAWAVIIDFIEGDKRAVRNFNVEELIGKFSEKYIETQGQRLYAGCTVQAPMDLFAIRRV